MNGQRRRMGVGLVAVIFGTPALAQVGPAFEVSTQSMAEQPAGQPSATVPPQPYVMSIPREEGEPPVPSRIVAQRGVVMAETPAERRKRKRDLDAMLQSTLPLKLRSNADKGLKPTAAVP